VFFLSMHGMPCSTLGTDRALWLPLHALSPLCSTTHVLLAFGPRTPLKLTSPVRWSSALRDGSYRDCTLDNEFVVAGYARVSRTGKIVAGFGEPAYRTIMGRSWPSHLKGLRVRLYQVTMVRTGAAELALLISTMSRAPGMPL